MANSLPTAALGGPSSHSGNTDDASSPETMSAAGIKKLKKSLVKDFSSVVLQAIILSAGAGIVWGVLRPTQEVVGAGNGQLMIPQESLDASFATVLTYVAVIAVAGLILGAVTYRRLPQRRGLVMQNWVGLSGLVGAGAFTLVGQFVGSFRTTDVAHLKVWETATIIPEFSTYIAGLVLPLVAMIVYWLGLVVLDDDSSESEQIVSQT